MEPKEVFKGYLKIFENDREYLFEGIQFDLMEQILAIMERKQISKTRLANLLRCSSSYITKLLKGDQNLTLRKLFDIGCSLGASLQINLQERVETPKTVNFEYAPSSPKFETMIFTLHQNVTPTSEPYISKERDYKRLTQSKNYFENISRAS